MYTSDVHQGTITVNSELNFPHAGSEALVTCLAKQKGPFAYHFGGWPGGVSLKVSRHQADLLLVPAASGARLFGAAGYYVEHPDQVGDAVKAALSGGGPAIIEIPIDPDEFPTPVAAIRRPDERG